MESDAFVRYNIKDVCCGRNGVMADMYCPKCKTLLNNDEKASGKCFNCGATFSTVLPKTKSNSSASLGNDGNTIGRILKAIGFLIIIFGTVGSIYIGNQRYKFSFVSFILPEIGTIVSGMMFIGFAEIIQLLQDIKDKIK